MSDLLDLADIQGNVLRSYGRFGFPEARYFLFHVDEASTGRDFLAALIPLITTSQRWTGADAPSPLNRPPVTLNVALTYSGLEAVGLAGRSLQRLPYYFAEGMARRAHVLGDVGDNGVDQWDPVWRQSAQDGGAKQVHLWVSMNAQLDRDGATVPELEQRSDWLLNTAADHKVMVLNGHGQAGTATFQRAAALRDPKGRPLPLEHFGFVDGISNPIFKGQRPKEEEERLVKGSGKLLPNGKWAPFETGEFLLGYADESQEQAHTAPPWWFMKNGTFMAYRKLHQDVDAWHSFVDEQSKGLSAHMDVPQEAAAKLLAAKIAGRWPDTGVPLIHAPSDAENQALAERVRQKDPEAMRMMRDFRYDQDVEGVRCPVGAHIRRANTRDMLDPAVSRWRYQSLNTKARATDGSSLNKRRRILRRGLPYGVSDKGSPDHDGEHGIIFMALCADLFRQFEFVQQQWMQYGLDFNVGSETCPLVGSHSTDSRFVIPVEEGSGTRPYIVTGLKSFVTTRGGDYFFIPSLTALRALAAGMVDPT